jgi:hypothetical protein
MKAYFLVIVLALTACATRAERDAKSFVHWDAISDAANSAKALCDGPVKLLKGASGYSPDDYACIRGDAPSPKGASHPH